MFEASLSGHAERRNAILESSRGEKRHTRKLQRRPVQLHRQEFGTDINKEQTTETKFVASEERE